MNGKLKIFQSTLPAREATNTGVLLTSTEYISIHASREGSDVDISRNVRDFNHFNPRFPRGKRLPPFCVLLCPAQFQSTLPAREATVSRSVMAYSLSISIHASREGSDIGSCSPAIPGPHFNPRFPRGKRHPPRPHQCRHLEFQSTLPAREATVLSASAKSLSSISIHASREGSDR